MELSFRAEAGLPTLAYCVRIREGRALVHHGEQVARGADFFHDGVWAGPFRDGRFDEVMSCGTGGRLVDGALRLVAPEVPLDRIVVAIEADEVVASNSLPLLLSTLDDGLDNGHPWYRDEFTSIERGVRISPKHLRTRRGRKLRLLLGEIADVTDQGAFRPRFRPLAPAPHGYADYRARLGAVTGALIRNATDEDRATPLRPIVPMSAGYDSTAVAVLGRDAGVTEALTMERHDPATGAPVDDPTMVAAALGLDLRRIARDRWRDRTDLPEADLAAGMTSMMDVALLTLDDLLPGRLVLSGVSGDNMWDIHNHRSYRDVVQGYGNLSMRSLAEHRLRVGYVVCCPAAIDHSAQPAIVTLSRSEEMAPWSVGGSYDRPIARRIAEDAGVPREAFGVKKYGGSARVGTSGGSYRATTRTERAEEIAEVMSPAAASSFLDFLEGVDLNRHRRSFRLARIGHRLYLKLDALNHRVGRRFRRSGIKAAVPRAVMLRLGRRCHFPPDYMIWLPHWGVEVLQGRDEGLTGPPTASGSQR